MSERGSSEALKKERRRAYLKEYARRWRHKNPDKAKAISIRYKSQRKDSVKASCAKYYKANAEKRRAQSRGRRMANIDAAREYDRKRGGTLRRKLQKKKYREENRDVVRKRKAKYYVENRTKIASQMAAYARDNPEKIKNIAHTRRARLVLADVGDTKAIENWLKSWRRKPIAVCFWCTARVKSVDCHMDHITPIAKGGAHSVGNLCVSCASCNAKKRDRMPDDWNRDLSQPVLMF